MDFTCNVCGNHNTGVEEFGREVQNCAECLSSVRIRALVYAVSQELFGTALPLRDFPVLKGLRCLGMTDSDSYAKRLAEKFDYKNTFFDREPKLDVTDIDGLDENTFDLLISSEVFEHVRPPFEKALENAFRLLRPNGVLMLTIPFNLDTDPSHEHYPQLADAGLAQLRSGPVLVNRTVEGKLQVFEDLFFHGGQGSTLEMRVLNQAALRRALLAAGFADLQFYAQDYAPFGIRHMQTWSVPVAARKQPFEFRGPLRTELLQQFGELNENLRRVKAEMHAEYQELYQELVVRSEWAIGLDQEIKAARATTERLDAELEKRTEWAHHLQRELGECNQRSASLETEVDSRTKWALDLEGQLEEQTRWALDLDARVTDLERELKAQRGRRWSRLGRWLRVAR